MRCPKCGYISYDHLAECLKCRKNIKSASDSFQGSVFNVEPPAFLQMPGESAESYDEEDLAILESEPMSEEFVDDDLEVLIADDDEQEETVDIDDEITLSDNSFEDDDSEFELDFSQLEDTDEPVESSGEEVEAGETVEEEPDEMSLSIEMPEALADISDLAPPAASEDSGGGTDAPPVGKEEDVDLGLEELDLDLGLGGVEEPVVAAKSGAEEDVLALDDINFSEALAGGDTETKAGGDDGSAKKADPVPTMADQSASDELSMDEELNFELDLGGLSINDEA